jgi:cell division protein FtsW (lipid II flippase)
MAKRSKTGKRSPSRMLVHAVMAFFFTAFLLLAIKDFSVQSVGMAVAVPALLYISITLLPRLFPADKLLLSLTNFLCALGVLLLYRLDASQGFIQAVNYGIGVACMLACILLVRNTRSWQGLIVIISVASIAFLLLPLLMGTEKNGAKAWITIAGRSMQPSEIVKIALLLIASYLLSRRHLVACIVFVGCCLGLLMLQMDLGTALLYYGVTLLMLYAATHSKSMVGLGFLGGIGAAAFGYTQFAHVKVRVKIWLNPWDQSTGSGYQIVKALIAMVNGGMLGMGLGMGNASSIPAYKTDFIFAVIMNEFGVLFGVLVLMIYLAIIIRGVGIALRARSAFYSLLALGCAALIALQTFVIIGGNIKLIPLTGVTLPFVSYGGTSLISSLCVIGLLQGVSSRCADELAEDESLAAGQEADR